jgi:hypothetical protein
MALSYHFYKPMRTLIKMARSGVDPAPAVRYISAFEFRA